MHDNQPYTDNLRLSIERQLEVKVISGGCNYVKEDGTDVKTFKVIRGLHEIMITAEQLTDTCWAVWEQNGDQIKWLFLDEVTTDPDFHNLCQHVPPEVIVDGETD